MDSNSSGNSGSGTVSIVIGGPAGSGVFSLGEIVGELLSGRGLYVSIYKEYPSLIRGGHNFMHIAASKSPVYVPPMRKDILVSLDALTETLHNAGEVISYSSVPETLPSRVAGVFLVSRLLSSMGFRERDIMEAVMGKFGKKGEWRKWNEIAVKQGASVESGHAFSENGAPARMLATGSEAVFLGAVKAGCRHYFAYPMTPASGLLHLYSSFPELVAKQAEDEIAAISMAIGASFAGRRAMVGTSGGGFSLMAEALSLAGMAEIPLVIVEAQRPGPSTGMPTFSSQEDLLFSIFSGHGEFARAVVSPGDISEAYWMIQDAFNIADAIQSPVIFLTEKNLMEGYGILEMRDVVARERRVWDGSGEANRYSLDSPAPPMPIPGQKGGEYVATSYEHDETGFTTEDGRMREMQVRRRIEKMEMVEPWEPVVMGKGNGAAVFGFGFTKSIAMEALKHGSFTYVHLPMLWPFPSEGVREIAGKFDRLFTFEFNATGQLSRLMKMAAGVEAAPITISHGRLCYPEEMSSMVREAMGNG